MKCAVVSVIQGWLLNTGKNNKERLLEDCYRVTAATK